MKLLFYRYGSICEPFLLSAFRTLGFSVHECSYEMTDKSLLPSECVRLLSEELDRDAYQFVFSINFFPAVSDVCNIFHIPYIGWTVDCPVMELYSSSIAHPWNYLFLFDRCQYQEIAPLNPGHVFYLPLATDPDMLQAAISKMPHRDRYRSDISFVGSLYTEKCPYDKLKNPPAFLKGFLDGVMDAQQKVYGYYFVEDILTDDVVQDFKRHLPGFYTPLDAPFLTDASIVAQLYIGNKITALERVSTMRLLAAHFSTDLYTLSDTSGIPGIHNRGQARTMTEMPVIFHESTINLNMTSKAIRSGIPLRTWDIAGCGGFQITNYQAELPEYFTPGEDIEVYASPEELLLEKCRYYLEHPKRAAEIAENGYESVCSRHTYRHRIEEMLQTVFGNQ